MARTKIRLQEASEEAVDHLALTIFGEETFRLLEEIRSADRRLLHPQEGLLRL